MTRLGGSGPPKVPPDDCGGALPGLGIVGFLRNSLMAAERREMCQVQSGEGKGYIRYGHDGDGPHRLK